MVFVERVAAPLKWLLVVGVVAVALPAAGWWFFMRQFLEQAPYEVTTRYDDFEVRIYRPRIIAEVDIQGDVDAASSRGFRALAGYIFGKNEGSDKIAMTAPVDMKPRDVEASRPVDLKGDQRRWTMAFTMPSEFSLEALPRPDDGRVRLRRTESKKYAVLQFSGKPNVDDVERRFDALRAAAHREGLRIHGEPVYARYDPPSTPGLLRRNEVMYEVVFVPKR